jgi:hypothetical protein
VVVVVVVVVFVASIMGDSCSDLSAEITLTVNGLGCFSTLVTVCHYFVFFTVTHCLTVKEWIL